MWHLDASIRRQRDLVNRKASIFALRRFVSENHRGRRAQHRIATRPDPAAVPVAVQNHNRPVATRNYTQDIRGIHKDDASPFPQPETSDRIFHEMVVNGDDPRGGWSRSKD